VPESKKREQRELLTLSMCGDHLRKKVPQNKKIKQGPLSKRAFFCEHYNINISNLLETYYDKYIPLDIDCTSIME